MDNTLNAQCLNASKTPNPTKIVTRDYEKEIQSRILYCAYDTHGVVEQINDKVYCLTNMLAALVQALIDKKVLSEEDLYDL